MGTRSQVEMLSAPIKDHVPVTCTFCSSIPNIPTANQHTHLPSHTPQPSFAPVFIPETRTSVSRSSRSLGREEPTGLKVDPNSPVLSAEFEDGPVGGGQRHAVGRLGLVERMFPYLRRRSLLLAQKMPQLKVRKRLSASVRLRRTKGDRRDVKHSRWFTVEESKETGGVGGLFPIQLSR